MARIPMTSGFSICPEGRFVFKIEEVDYDENFGSLKIKLVTENGRKHMERFQLMDANGDANERALSAFSFFAKTALKKYDMDDIDPQELVGCYIGAEVQHTETPSKKDPSRMMTFANLGEKWEAEPWGSEKVQPKANVSLDDLLG